MESHDVQSSKVSMSKKCFPVECFTSIVSLNSFILSYRSTCVLTSNLKLWVYDTLVDQKKGDDT